MYSFESKIIAKRKITGSTWQVEFEKPQNFSAKAGQYIWLVLKIEKFPDPRGDRRAFSLISLPEEPSLKVLFRESESGFKKTLLSQKEGEPIIIIGPFGSLGFPQDPTAPVVCIAGGVGIAPFLPLIQESVKSSSRKIILLYANRLKEDVPYQSFLHELSSNHPQFSVISITGEINKEVLKDAATRFLQANWFIIGPEKMVSLVTEGLYSSGISESQMVFEEFYWTKERFGMLPSRNMNDLSIFKLAMEQISNHVILTDIDGKIVFANKAAEKITGYSFGEMQNQTSRLWGGVETPEFYQKLWQIIKIERKPFSAEIKNRRKNGEIYDAIVRISPFLENDNTLSGFIGTEEDISTRKMAEQKLIEEKTKDEAILASIGDGIITVDKNGIILIVNSKAEKLLNIKVSEAIGKVYRDFWWVEDESGKKIEDNLRPIEIVLKTKRAITDSSYSYANKNTRIPVSVTISPVILNGELLGAVDVFRDVTHEREVDRAKTEFVSLASHQLRTPLAVMKWFCEMLLNGDAGQLTPEQKEYTQNISDSNDRIIVLVNALLNISRIEEGRLGVQPEPTDIKNLISEVLGLVKKNADEKKQQVNVFVNQNLPLINIDPKLIREVYINLLSNAIKYTPLGGKISMMISASPSQLISRISDLGIGIPKSQQGRVFEKFFRADNAVKFQSEGTGLGLYLAKAIIQSSGGKIWFESEENRGTSFIFSLPLTGSPAKKGEVTLNS